MTQNPTAATAAPPSLVCTVEDLLLGKVLDLSYADGFLTDPVDVISHPLADLGFRLIDIVYGKGNLEPERAYGFCCENARQDEQPYRVLAIRGTEIINNDPAEWFEDAECAMVACDWDDHAGRVHYGFHAIVESLRMSCGVDFGKIGLSKVVGHSLGAAVAQGFAGKYAIPYAGLWACPKFGDASWCHWVEGRVFRIFRPVCIHDLVPTLPPDFPKPPLPAIFSYCHAGAEAPFDPSRYVNPGVSCFHALRTYLHAADPSYPLEPKCVPTGKTG